MSKHFPYLNNELTSLSKTSPTAQELNRRKSAFDPEKIKERCNESRSLIIRLPCLALGGDLINERDEESRKFMRPGDDFPRLK